LIYRGQGERQYEVEAYVKNVEDKNIKANANVVMVEQVPYPLAVYQPPRTWGVRLRYHF
jgi:iron complex outermembrane receptor protein